MTTVGVRELRQNASALLAQVEATGESVLITSHGRPVGRLVPAEATSREQLLASGALRAGRGSVLDVQPVHAPSGTPPTEELLERDDR